MHKAFWLALFVCCMVSSYECVAQTSEPSDTAPGVELRTDAIPATQSAAQPAESRITEYRLAPDKLEKSTALYRTRTILFVLGTVYGIAVLFLILGLRVGARFRDIAERKSTRRFVQVLIFTPLLVLTMDVLTLPLSVYGHHLANDYGFSVQSWGSWLWDWVKGELLSIVVATLLIWGLYAILRRTPTRWWFYGWLAMIPVLLLLVFIQPTLIDPMFNKFDPLEAKQPQLVAALERVTQRGGLEIPRSKMFEMRASDKVTTYNAYVTGIGASKRVVVWDNTSRDMSVPETMFVFGHEQGHYVLNHVWKGLTLSIAGLLAVLYIAYRLLGGIIRRWGPRWGVRDQGDWASLPVLLLIFSVVSTVSQPVAAAVSRYFEHQADVYGLEVIHGLVPDSSQVAAHAFQKLGEKALEYPTPSALDVFWTYDHPPIDARLRFAVGYHPWDEGKPTQFVHER
ncbi:MAG TPA: M48 family metallopeptidase [Steroidobacteraceae bacterium]|jgi:Zn-dependent protease with chaperone function